MGRSKAEPKTTNPKSVKKTGACLKSCHQKVLSLEDKPSPTAASGEPFEDENSTIALALKAIKKKTQRMNLQE